MTGLLLYAAGVLLIVSGVGINPFSVKTTWILTLISVKLLKFALLGGTSCMLELYHLQAFPHPLEYVKPANINNKELLPKMDNNNFTILKNMLLNWLYSSDRHVSLDELGQWLQLNTGGGRYRLIDLTESSETKANDIRSCA